MRLFPPPQSLGPTLAGGPCQHLSHRERAVACARPSTMLVTNAGRTGGRRQRVKKMRTLSSALGGSAAAGCKQKVVARPHLLRPQSRAGICSPDFRLSRAKQPRPPKRLNGVLHTSKVGTHPSEPGMPPLPCSTPLGTRGRREAPSTTAPRSTPESEGPSRGRPGGDFGISRRKK